MGTQVRFSLCNDNVKNIDLREQDWVLCDFISSERFSCKMKTKKTVKNKYHSLCTTFSAIQETNKQI